MIYPGYDPDTYRVNGTPHATPPCGDGYVLYVGNLLPHKNLLNLLDALAILRRRHRGPRLITREEIIAVARDALDRAEAARDTYFEHYDIPACAIEEINPIDADNTAMAYYRPPAVDGSRPGAHCLLTTNPGDRFRYEYQALAFHESVPGHHLQLATAQTNGRISRNEVRSLFTAARDGGVADATEIAELKSILTTFGSKFTTAAKAEFARQLGLNSTTPATPVVTPTTPTTPITTTPSTPITHVPTTPTMAKRRAVRRSIR